MGKESISAPPYINVCEHAKTITKLSAGGTDDRLEISKHVIWNINIIYLYINVKVCVCALCSKYLLYNILSILCVCNSSNINIQYYKTRGLESSKKFTLT